MVKIIIKRSSTNDLWWLFRGWMVCLFHFRAKFQAYACLWEKARAKGDRHAQGIFWKAEMLAHSDTSMAMLWPLVIHRWNADYIAEAQKS